MPVIVTVRRCVLLLYAFAAPAFADEAKTMSEEKQAISFFSVACVQTGGKTARIEQQLGKAAAQIDKKILAPDYRMEQSEDVWTVASAGKDPYIVSVTKSGVCYVALSASDPAKLKQEFKTFVSEQAAAIKAKAEITIPDMQPPADMLMDFYDIKIPGSEHKIKFSLAVPKDAANARRSTMTIASE